MSTVIGRQSRKNSLNARSYDPKVQAILQGYKGTIEKSKEIIQSSMRVS